MEINNTEVHAVVQRIVGAKANLVDTAITVKDGIKMFVGFKDAGDIGADITNAAIALTAVTGKPVSIIVQP
jgi:hypothetical protein